MEKYHKYLQYIVNTGGRISQYQFCDDWEPIGSMLLVDMEAEGLIVIRDHDITVELSLHGIAVLEELKNGLS
jgi:hypothetical protein